MKETQTMAIAVVAVIISVIAIASSIALRPAAPALSTGSVGSNELADNTVAGDKIVDGAITDADIISAGISRVAGGAVGSAQIADNSITLLDLSSAVTDVITGVENIADNSITSAKIADGTITSDDIGSGAVNSSDIADGTIAAADLTTAVSNRLGKVATKIVAADGSGDYTDIQSAINALPASGGAVYIREGTYTVSSSIAVPSNVALIGAGTATKIFLANGANTDVITASGVHNVIIADLRIDGNKTNQTEYSHGIEFTNVENSRISGCWVEEIYGYGIYFVGSSNNVITSNTVRSNSYSGIALNSSNNNIVMGNTVRSNGLNGIYLGYSSNNVLTGNVFMNNSQTIAGNYNGIDLLGSDYNVITSNRSTDDQTAKTQRYGVYISAIGCDNNLVATNVLIGNLSASLIDSGTGTLLASNLTA